MAYTRYRKNASGFAARFVVLGLASSVLAVGVGLGVASAGAGASDDIDAFGISSMSSPAPSSEAALLADSASEAAFTEPTALESAAPRDISQGVATIQAEEEAARLAAEEAARIEEAERIAAAEEAKAVQQVVAAQEPVVETTASMVDVDWNVGKEAFVAEWGARIDAYLAGSPLAGYGSVFAMAAWDNGVDPRWSPAISNTESTKGANCFLPYNAWGWGDHGWSSWEEAIYAHVSGLAAGYGYSLTYENAAKYCPPHAGDWYNTTLSQMQMI